MTQSRVSYSLDLGSLWLHFGSTVYIQRISAEDAKLQTVHRESVAKLVVGM